MIGAMSCGTGPRRPSHHLPSRPATSTACGPATPPTSPSGRTSTSATATSSPRCTCWRGWWRTPRPRRYEVLRRIEIEGGALQQHVLHGTVASTGKDFSMPACLVITIDGDAITHVDEYLDPAVHAAGVRRRTDPARRHVARTRLAAGQRADRHDGSQHRHPVVEAGYRATDHLRRLIGAPQPRRVGAVRVGRELGRLRLGHGTALELEAERAAVAQHLAVRGIGRGEVALRRDVERDEPGDAVPSNGSTQAAPTSPWSTAWKPSSTWPMSCTRPATCISTSSGAASSSSYAHCSEWARMSTGSPSSPERVEHAVAGREPAHDLLDVGSGGEGPRGHGTRGSRYGGRRARRPDPRAPRARRRRLGVAAARWRVGRVERRRDRRRRRPHDRRHPHGAVAMGALRRGGQGPGSDRSSASCSRTHTSTTSAARPRSATPWCSGRR